MHQSQTGEAHLWQKWVINQQYLQIPKFNVPYCINPMNHKLLQCMQPDGTPTN